MSEAKDRSKHPCFNKSSFGSCGRVHLPVAPGCNIQCNYCNRKYDCVNESRPGVTSAVLPPDRAVEYLDEVLRKEPRITVVGIAGPGDPMAEAEKTIATIERINAKYPDMLYCLSSNGLALPEHVDRLVELGVTHVTVTMNAVDPEIGAKIYSWVRVGKVVYRGVEGARILLERQLESIRLLKARGVTVKVNSIVIPGVNDHHLAEVGRVAAELGADIQNLIPLHPTGDTPFAGMEEPSKELINELRAKNGETILQMTHCRRCRADAVGLLCSDRSSELIPTLNALACGSKKTVRPYVAVASREGMLVNMHLGEAPTFQIWAPQGKGARMIEERVAPEVGCGPDRWRRLAEILHDCSLVLVEAAGKQPKQVLGEEGISVLECNGLISDIVAEHYLGGNIMRYRIRPHKAGCVGMGGGCG
ncbi:MAG: nitrogenase cofactor biosynthesis protein NifB [Desulfomicrobium sp.]